LVTTVGWGVSGASTRELHHTQAYLNVIGPICLYFTTVLVEIFTSDCIFPEVATWNSLTLSMSLLFESLRLPISSIANSPTSPSAGQTGLLGFYVSLPLPAETGEVQSLPVLCVAVHLHRLVQILLVHSIARQTCVLNL
jgi:hypothetical protein